MSLIINNLIKIFVSLLPIASRISHFVSIDTDIEIKLQNIVNCPVDIRWHFTHVNGTKKNPHRTLNPFDFISLIAFSFIAIYDFFSSSDPCANFFSRDSSENDVREVSILRVKAIKVERNWRTPRVPSTCGYKS